MSTDKFHDFAAAIRAQFNEMAQSQLLEVDSDRDAIWATYLGAFPPGADPVFRERTEHDCSCCRQFIRSVGGVVCVQNGALASVWDVAGLPLHYQVVADAMSAHVKALPIRGLFLTKFAQHGVEQNRELGESGSVITWQHFSVKAPARVVTPRCGELRGEARTTYQVLKRGCEELDPEAVQQVRDLIASGTLYRGAEYAEGIEEFAALQARALAALDRYQRDLVYWSAVGSRAARFRNTVVGTLVQALSEGEDLERAVRAYEVKVAPQNYKRPTALITKKMVEDAMRTVCGLGLEDALERRHARLGDVSVDSVLFVDNAVRGRLRGGVEDLLMEEVRPKPADLERAEDIDVDDFVASVLPKAQSVRLFLDNGKLGNFASITAPARADAGRLFRWGNDFAWSYEGNAADSIKERVKRAGGRVEGVSLRASLSWSNYDDLDIHVVEPGGHHIYFGNKAGVLDVDMNAGSGTTREPVENLRWVGGLRDGTYRVFVNQYAKRESTGPGFEVEVECDGRLENFRYERGVRQNQNVEVVQVVVKSGRVADIRPSDEVVGGATPREQWGLRTQQLVRVNSVVLSPNHWCGDASGAKHWFFILDGCRNPQPTRGIYNEFLSPKLAKHRKVFEVLGDKTKCPPADEQMSGVGFTRGRGDKVVVAVSGKKINKVYHVAF